MITNIEKFVTFLSTHAITAHQFMLPYMLYLDEKTKDPKTGKMYYPYQGSVMANLYRYSMNVRGWTQNEVEDLVKKKLLKDGEFSRPFKADLMEPTEYFIEQIFAPFDRFDELLQEYPKWMDNIDHPNGPKIPLTIVEDMDKLEATYKRVVRTKAHHDEVIELVRWAKQEDILKLAFRNFIGSRHWENLKELRETHVSKSGRYGLEQA
jgi:hypothetical protein